MTACDRPPRSLIALAALRASAARRQQSGTRTGMDDTLLTVAEAAIALQCSPKTVYAASSDGRLTSIRTNSGIRIPASEVERHRGCGRKTLGSRSAARVVQGIHAMDPYAHLRRVRR